MIRTEPVLALFTLWYRPSSGGRWLRLGRYATRAEATNAIGDAGSGDYWIEEQRPDAEPAAAESSAAAN
jgi:hypothetical protein